MSALQLAIFDCDGVLVDSEIIAAEVEAEMLTEFGFEFTAGELGARFAGLTWGAIVKRLEEETGRAFPDDFAGKVEAAVKERIGREVQAVPGVHAMLDLVDLPRCICSNSATSLLQLELKRVDLWDRFRPYVFSAVEVGSKAPKPAPDVFLHACREFEVDPGAAIVIEDSVHGVHAAIAAGCRVVGFTGGKHTWAGHADALTEAGAETVIGRLADYPATVEALSLWRGD
ncbi:HAD family hydrolase [Antarcticirhabdus aurantiaca]|uniref:HAD-IA family hydrolase n=1 Tax=Antarcticirhabdus aurantiaca TaxID=2606717 RepID=A0ACD4NS79_9HYPH|nr:HAD-IA family hydrolase [Antarcticirhabdus aurantiaca]WAJ29647.1 HAD-IA family hydrolase [Jeongeuplla avenae]